MIFNWRQASFAKKQYSFDIFFDISRGSGPPHVPSLDRRIESEGLKHILPTKVSVILKRYATACNVHIMIPVHNSRTFVVHEL